MKRYIAVIELDDDEEIVGDANVSYTYRCNGTNYGTDESVELKAEDEVQGMKTYEDGLNEAWEAARKVVCDGGYNYTELERIFGKRSPSRILEALTASEVIAKIEEQDIIHVGDEVVDSVGNKGVVMRVHGVYLTLVESDGTAIRLPIEKYKKTGRHFPQIEEVFKQMTEEPKAKHSDRAVADRLCMACKYGDLCVDAEVCQDCFFDRTKPNFEEAEYDDYTKS